jgi:hypothetical protein
MAPISYEKATSQGLIKESDLKRMAAALLANIDNFKVPLRGESSAGGWQINSPQVDYELCAKSYGGSKEAFRVALQGLLRNLRSRGCEMDGESSTPAGKATPSTPKTGRSTGSAAKTPRSRKKREDEDSDYESTPSKKPRVSGRGKAVPAKTEATDGLAATVGELAATHAVVEVEEMDESAFTV